MTAGSSPLLDVRDLVGPARRLRRVRPTVGDGVSLQVRRGETYGVVGESGSGAAELAHAVVAPPAGRVLLDGVDLADMDASRRRRLIGVLRPHHDRGRVASLLTEEVRSAGLPDPTPDELAELVESVGLPSDVLDRGVDTLPVGRRRRVDIARALCAGPALVVADDPVAGLDVTVAAQLLDLLRRLKAERGLSYLLIARDLGVVRHLSDRVGVLYGGRIVEEAPARSLYRGPLHPYTRALLSAVPVPDPEVEDRRERILLAGDPPGSPAAVAVAGCAFRPRCPWSRPERCADERPLLRTVRGAGHLVACHHAEAIVASMNTE